MAAALVKAALENAKFIGFSIMKISKQKLEEIIKEEIGAALSESNFNYKNQILNEGQVEDYIRSQNLETFGDLVKFMKLVRSKKRSVEGLKAIADWATDIAGKGLVSHLVNTYVRKKPTDPQDFMKLFRIDPKYAAIIDNDVEEAFVQWFMKEVDNDTSNLAQIRLDSDEFDINNVLRRWLAGTYDGRTVGKR